MTAAASNGLLGSLMPAEAGIQARGERINLDSRLRENDNCNCGLDLYSG